MSENDTSELMEEFKALSQLVRSGQSLSPDQMARRKELRGYLKEVLLGRTGDASVPPTAPSPAPQTSSEEFPAPPGSHAPPSPRPAQEFKPHWAPDSYKADTEAVENATAQADRDLAAQQKGPRPNSPQEAGEMYLKKKAKSIYTAPVDNYHVSAYYGDYLEAGYEFMNMDSVSMAPLDSRAEDLQGGGATNATDDRPYTLRVPSNMAFLDDYPIIYELGLLPTPDQDADPDGDDPNMWIPAKRRVILHMLNGQTRRGMIDVLKKGDTKFAFTIQGTDKRGTIKIEKVKAIFVQSSPNSEIKKPTGKVVTVTFNDRRTIQGVSNDYEPDANVFTLVPQANNNQFERVIVNGKSVIEVT